MKDLTRCFGIRDNGLENVNKFLNFKYLNLYALPYLECAFLESLNENCMLEFLDFSGNSKINDEKIVKASGSLKNIKKLVFVSLEKVMFNVIVVVCKYYRQIN